MLSKSKISLGAYGSKHKSLNSCNGRQPWEKVKKRSINKNTHPRMNKNSMKHSADLEEPVTLTSFNLFYRTVVTKDSILKGSRMPLELKERQKRHVDIFRGCCSHKAVCHRWKPAALPCTSGLSGLQVWRDSLGWRDSMHVWASVPSLF